MSQDSAQTAKSGQKRKAFSIVSMCLLVALVLLRAMSTHEPFPMWDSDPYLFGSPMTGITSGYAVLLNAAVMALSVVILVCTPKRDGRADSAIFVLLGIGYAGLAFHLVRDPETLLNGSTLGAMMGSIVASRAFIRVYPEWLRVFGPIVLGMGVALAVYGLHQVFVQHPRTVAMYDANRESFLNARGWNAGSFEMLTYERRLRQPEPTGWFGLSNVYASFIAGIGVAMVMVTLCSLKKAWWILSGLIAAGLLAVLVISKSKGGIGAAVLGFGTIQYALMRRRGRVNRIGTATLGGCVLIMLGVIGGGMMHQLSLLFRGQYMVGSLRIFREYPLIGVGPGRFQDAYMIHKPSTSPEDVTSAHNLVFDLLAQLGIAGIAWIGVLVLMIWASRLPITNDDDTEQTGLSRGVLVRLVPLMVLVIGIGSIRLQTGAMDLELMLLMLGAVGVWIVASVLIALYASRRTLRIAMLSVAIVLVLHGMLDLTPVWVVSAPCFGLCLELGFGYDANEKTSTVRFMGIPRLIGALGLACAAGIAGAGSLGTIQRDQQLIELAEPAQEIAQIRSLLMSSYMDQGGARTDLAQRVSVLSGRPVPANERSILELLDDLELQSRIVSTRGLMELSDRHRDPKLSITALEQAMKLAMILDHEGSAGSDALWGWVSSEADRLESGARTFSEFKWAGQSRLTLAQYDLGSSNRRTELLDQAMRDWTRAETLNPHDPKHAIRLMDLAEEMGDRATAEHWAQLAIRRSERMRLDPLKQLSPPELRRAQRLGGATVPRAREP